MMMMMMMMKKNNGLVKSYCNLCGKFGIKFNDSFFIPTPT